MTSNLGSHTNPLNAAYARTNHDSDHVRPTQSLHRLFQYARLHRQFGHFELRVMPSRSPPTLPHHPPNPHRVSRAKSTEQ
ncbi:uncharacterized protein LACBIDRAFT_306981 [Laccaria bicolor S238N-H82]|uniref:Predicted protein n=1 Tax=Laccaria bicolor (strain S238N-H82 / ATCC MYA-4686) TaxID=486041 RepID=B0DP37_LACBS|nr:uncharacterized protein LACBIDRAFT_306981 [Laccaria bicolor S238N-H82]EDR03544.1 predicted protein [Laccaria bicolor S238N-H82]|eukprot:XP_001885692.1 predicted protein [Laccaria bicolor S238N-H82]